MFRSRFFCLLTALLCLGCLVLPARAAQVDAGSVYCFGTADFSDDESLAGICITQLPEGDLGALTLGSRVIRSGDILTAQQVEQLIFSPLLTETDRTAQIGYLPVFESYVAPRSTVTIRILGKEDKAPIAQDSATETYKNMPSTAQLKASDPEGQALTYTVTRQPKRGSVSVSQDGSFTYTPKKNKVGVDSFTYTAADPAGNVSREATVTVTILKPTSAPQYTDTAGRGCSFAAEWMKHTGIFVGESLGEQSCFQPDKEVTRGEFVTMLVKAMDIPTDEYLTYTGYTDEIPLWLQPYLAAAVRSGLTAGLAHQETFGANTPITGADAAILLENALDGNEAALAALQPEASEVLTRGDAAQLLYAASKFSGTGLKDTLV